MSRRLCLAIAVVVGLLAPDAARSQSLADVARAEAERRKAIGNRAVKVYTNEDLGGAAAEAPEVPSPAPVGASGGSPSTTKPEPAPPVAGEPVRDEKYWKTRLAAARENLQRSQAFFDALQSHINGLYAEFVAMGDPIQRAAIEKKRLEAIAEQARVKADIATHTKTIAAIEEEARRASVPPGWLR